MKWMPFGRKALEFIKRPLNSHKKISILSGSVRSGKTMLMVPKVLQFIKDGPEDGIFFIVGASKDTIYMNFLVYLFETVGKNNYSYNRASGDLTIFGRTCKVVGAKDNSSERYIRGATACGAYVDEATLIPKGFMFQLINRCSVPGALIFMTTNPDSPFHYLYKEYIQDLEKQNIVEVVNFHLNDNPNLTDEYKDFVSKAYSGVSHQRFVEGRWVIAEGIIFDMFKDEIHIKPTVERKYEQYQVGVDFGTMNATTFLLLGKYKGKWYVIKEYYYSGRDENVQKTTEDYVVDYIKWIGKIRPQYIVIDPSATPLVAAFKKAGIQNIKHAKNNVQEGICAVQQMFKNEELYVNDCCKNFINELKTYAWDEKASQRGEDEPIKVNDHACDACRYAINTVIARKASWTILK